MTLFEFVLFGFEVKIFWGHMPYFTVNPRKEFTFVIGMKDRGENLFCVSWYELPFWNQGMVKLHSNATQWVVYLLNKIVWQSRIKDGKSGQKKQATP